MTPMAVRANKGQSLNSVSMLGQRLIRLAGIEPAIGCNAGLTLHQHWVLVLCVPSTSYRLSL